MSPKPSPEKLHAVLCSYFKAFLFILYLYLFKGLLLASGEGTVPGSLHEQSVQTAPRQLFPSASQNQIKEDHIFADSVLSLEVGEAIEFSFDIRFVLRNEVTSLQMLDLAVMPTDHSEERSTGKVGLRFVQGVWDKGGASPGGTLTMILDPYDAAKHLGSINLADIGISQFGTPSARTTTDELHVIYTIGKLPVPGEWITHVYVEKKETGSYWEAYKYIHNEKVYSAPALIPEIRFSKNYRENEGGELLRLSSRIIQLEERFQELKREESPRHSKKSTQAWKHIPFLGNPSAIPFISIPTRQHEIVDEVRELNKQLATLPFPRETLQFDAYGCHGGYLQVLKTLPEKPRWTAEFFFPYGELQEVILVPSIDRRYNTGASYGFPERFRVVLIKPNGNIHLVGEWLKSDFPNGGSAPITLKIPDARIVNNIIRIEVFRGARESNRELFALDEVFAVANEEVFKPSEVSISSEFESKPFWAKEYMIDQKTHLGLPVGPKVDQNIPNKDFSVVFPDMRTDSCVLELDMGGNRKIGWIELFPATPTNGILIPGYGFPGKIRIEAIRETRNGGRDRVFTIPSTWEKGNPGHNVVRLDGYNNDARWIRLIADELPIHNGNRTFGLGEINIYKSGKSHPLKSIKLEGFPDGAEDEAHLMIDQHSYGQPIMQPLEWLRLIEVRDHLSRLLENRLSVLEVIQTRWKAGWSNAVIIAVIVLLFVTACVVVMAISQRQHLKLSVLRERQNTEAEQMKMRFFTHISHELRTPLTVILGPLEKLLRAPQDAQTSRQMLSLAVQNVKKLQGLVNQLLDFRKLQDGRGSLELTPIDFVQHVRNGANIYRSMAIDKGIDYQLLLPDSPVWVMLDSGKFRKITDNLISNALKYTPSEGAVRVFFSYSSQVEAKKAVLRLTVEDSGTGIAEEDLPHVFNQYFRAKGLEPALAAGSGIGLALVKELVDLMDGTITVESPIADGRGARFTVVLSVDIAESNSQVIDCSEVKAESLESGCSSHVNNGEVIKATEPNTKAHLKILVIDDNPDILTYLHAELKELYYIHKAQNGKEGLNQIRQLMPDLILCDVMMPEMNGTELCQILKNTIEISHIPIILLTARGSEEHQVEGLKVGADDYISKPFSMPVLHLRIKNLLESRQKIRERFRREITVDPSAITAVPADEKFLKQAIEAVETYMDKEEFGVVDLAKELNLGRTTLFIKLRALIDQSPLEFIRMIRLKRSRQLLESSGDSIAEIAFQVGFPEPTNFSRAFKKQFGLTPSAFRKSLYTHHNADITT